MSLIATAVAARAAVAPIARAGDLQDLVCFSSARELTRQRVLIEQHLKSFGERRSFQSDLYRDALVGIRRALSLM